MVLKPSTIRDAFIGIKCTQELKDRFERHCKSVGARGLSVSEAIVQLIERELLESEGGVA